MEEIIIPIPEEVTVDWEAKAAELLKQVKRMALKLLFCKADCSDEEYLCYRFYDKAEFSEEGDLLNGEEILFEAKENFGEFFKKVKIEGIRPAEYGKAPVLEKKDFAAMSYHDRVKLYQQDRELYHQLTESK